jgi:hypothetical protein
MFLIKDWLNGFFGQFLTTYRLFLLNKLLVIRSILTRSVLFFVLHFICLFIIFISYVFQPLFLLHVFYFSLLCCDDLWLCCNFQLNCQVLFFMSWYVFFFFIVLLFGLTMHRNFSGCVVIYSYLSFCFHQGIFSFLHHKCLFFSIVPWFYCDALCMFFLFFGVIRISRKKKSASFNIFSF